MPAYRLHGHSALSAKHAQSVLPLATLVALVERGTNSVRANAGAFCPGQVERH